MRKFGILLLFGCFTWALLYVSTIRLLDWYQTGRLAVHKTSPLGGPGFATYASDPIGFTIEFDLYLLLLTSGALGVLMTCRGILLAVFGPRDFLSPHGLLDQRRTWQLVMLCYWVIAIALLIIAAVNKSV
ncbi:hypothetical protein JQ633_21310 [Bradyrhizobium tropiciagri]|uniref:hypothetical protein n=1 Tax=Bradyrhizobium tropiciagri TaxID=312253 RepID=UPI001BAD65AD|nr:hypothetical protein [Bradyrhizobium tropiciagri]MBR0872913.1 hypothetical protein [Bradyrhizobium tropiciagri]